MNLTTITTLTGAACAAVTAWLLGGREGVGVALGFLAAGSTSGLCIAVQRGAARSRPHLLLHAVLGGFLVKALVMFTLTLAIHHVSALSGRADSLAFLFSFAATSLVILLPATIDTLRLLGPVHGSVHGPVHGPPQAASFGVPSGTALSAQKSRVP